MSGAPEPGYSPPREPGFRPGRKVYRIVYEDMPGFVIRARSMDTATFLRIGEFADRAEVRVSEAVETFETFADHLVSWNLEYGDDEPGHEPGEPVPATRAGVMSQPPEMLNKIILGWLEAVAGVAPPLPPPSGNGSPSLVESLPMDELSPNLPSSTALA